MPGTAQDRLAALRTTMQEISDATQAQPSLWEIVRLSAAMSRAMSSYFDILDEAIMGEFRDIGAYIQTMKSDIANLQANELRQEHLPTAGRELDAVVTATEDATNAIMECAERIMAADDSDPAAYKAAVDEEVMKIFEACSFQDITGQRISKVVETLQLVESRVGRFAAKLRVADADGPMSDDEAARLERKRELMLDGPQAPGAAIAQDEVDSLLRAG